MNEEKKMGGMDVKERKKMGGMGRWVGLGGGQGRCERRSDVFVNIPKKIVGGRVRGGGGVGLGGGGVRVGVNE